MERLLTSRLQRIAQILLHSILFVALAAFPTWHDEEVKKSHFFSQSFAVAAQVGGGAAALFGFMSAIWQHAAAVTVKTFISPMTYGMVTSHVGAAAMALGWLSYFLPMGVFATIVFVRTSFEPSRDNMD